MSRSESTRIKSLVTSQRDCFRRKYGTAATEKPRRCVFIGTTNDDVFLTRDMTFRRWWVVQCGTKQFNLRWLADNRDQIIAEARYWQLQGEVPVLPVSVRTEHRTSVEDVHLVHPFESLLTGWDAKQPAGMAITMQACVEEGLGRLYGTLTMPEVKRIGEIMRVLGWARVKLNGERKWRKND